MADQLHQSMLVLHAQPGRGADVVDYYRSAKPIEVSVPYGVLRGELARSAQDPDLLVVSSLWRARSAYDDWLAAPERVGLTDGLMQLLVPDAATATVRVDLDDDRSRAERPLDLAPVLGDGEVERAVVVRP